MIKRRIIIGLAVIVFLSGIYAAYRYSQYILVWQANPKIHIDNIKLMMTQDEVRSVIGKEEEYIHGFGGYKLAYPGKGIFLDFLNDMDTDFYNKVSAITTSNPEHQVLGVRVGQKFEEAINAIKTQGFTREKEGYPGYWKMNMYVVIEKDSGAVKSITIGVRDRVSSSRVY